MALFKVMIEGMGFRVPGDQAKVAGFYVNRFVSAPSAEAASTMAINELRLEDKYVRFAAKSQTAGWLAVKSVEPVSGQAPDTKSGFVFYPEDAK